MPSRFLKLFWIFTLCFASLLLGLLVQASAPKNLIARSMLASAEKLFGLNFTDKKRDMMLEGLRSQLDSYLALRKVPLPNEIPPAYFFDPLPKGIKLNQVQAPFKMSAVSDVDMPSNPEDLAFYSIGQLGELLKSQRITSEQLTRLYLDRLKRYGPKLECVVTLTEELALGQAKQADAEIAAGRYRGPLHGIPYGAKDLLATRGIRTTWGSGPYKDQIIDEDATVIRRLREAGAILLAKLTLGELAMGDIWYGGMTRNPWNLKEGSSGSSAGSAAATSAGLVAFAIGSETLGSIVSPSTRCGTTGLRPTFGRVSRKGAMTLSWSMDKIGPICRTVEDCALVLNAIYGPDGEDRTVIKAPFNYESILELGKLRIGYLKKAFEEEKEKPEKKEEDGLETSRQNDESTLAKLRSLGAVMVPIELPPLPIDELSLILSAESAAAFDELTRSGKDDQLKRQIKDAWPNNFRISRFIPAVEYIQASRIRTLLIQQMAQLMEKIDVYVAPSADGKNLTLTNLTGHPCVVVPNGFSQSGSPTSITFTGRLFDEGTVLAVAKKYQDATGFHLKHPTLPD